MFLTTLSVRRPVLMTMVILVFVVLGFFSYRRLVVDLIPKIDLPFVTVTTIYPGASPEEVELQVTKKIEDAASNISGIKHITSTSSENFSFVGIEFDMDVDVNFASIDIKDEIDKIRRELPDDAEDPTVAQFDLNAEPVINLAISGARPLSEVHELADNQIRDEISKIRGIAAVEIVGGRQREIRVSLDRERLRAYGLSIDQVRRAIAAENLSVPAGHITETWQEYTVRTVGEFESVDDLARMRIPLRDGGMIELRELGQVLDTYAEVRELARFEGRNAVGMSIKKQGDANTVATVHGIHEAIARLRQTLPEDIQISIAREKASHIEASVDDVIQNILIGILLTAILLYLFTHTWQATIIAALSVPTSLVATFLLVDFAGFTINVMTLMSLSVSIGVLVTNALIVLENIINHVERGEEPAAAAEIGTREIAVAIIASTATNIVVFTPIAFMSGIVGQFFKQFGLTVVFATIFSLFISFTLTPMMASKLLERRQKPEDGSHSPLNWFSAAWDRAYAGLTADYRQMLSWCLGHRIVTVGAALLTLGFSVYLFGYIGGEFMPSTDQNMILVELEMPPGTPLQETDQALRRVEQVLRSRPEVETLYTTIGGQNKGVEESEILVQIIPRGKRDKGVTQLINELRPLLAAIPGAEIKISIPSVSSETSDIVVEVTGPDMDALYALSEQVRQIMQGIDGLVDVQSSYKPARDELVFVPDRARMADLNIPTGLVASLLRTSFEGNVASVYRDAGEEYDIRVKLAEGDRNRLGDVELISIASGDHHLPIDQLGRLEMRPGMSEIKRKEKERMIEVKANVGEGSQAQMVALIQQAADQLELKPGYRIGFGGHEEIRREMGEQILMALIMAILLTYMVLAAIMESYVHPFTIMLTLPLGLIGVAFALFLGNQTLNMMSQMAIVMLVGIVVNNAILILDYAQQLRKEGTSIRDALLVAAPTRLRPIIMANLAIALSMVPQVTGGAGAEFRTAMAVVTIGGVLLSAVFTLFVIPVIYITMDRLARQPATGD